MAAVILYFPNDIFEYTHLVATLLIQTNLNSSFVAHLFHSLVAKLTFLARSLLWLFRRVHRCDD